VIVMSSFDMKGASSQQVAEVAPETPRSCSPRKVLDGVYQMLARAAVPINSQRFPNEQPAAHKRRDRAVLAFCGYIALILKVSGWQVVSSAYAGPLAPPEEL
jgi:hypothetical protein